MLSIFNSPSDKKLADIVIEGKSQKSDLKHFDINIDFNPIHLKGSLIYPKCRYGFTEFYVEVKLSTKGKISNYTKTNLKKVVREVKEEDSSEKTGSMEIKVSTPEGTSITPKVEMKAGKKRDVSTSLEDYESDLAVLKSKDKLVRWKYKDFPKLQRKVLESGLDLYFEWEFSKTPIKGKIEMDIFDADFFDINNKKLKNFQKQIAKYALKKQEGVSLGDLENIYKSFEFSE